MLCCPVFSLVFFLGQGETDIIKFKKGGKQRCVIIEETEDSVHFMSRTGTCTMPRSRIGAIEYESEEANAALEESWKEKKRKAPEEDSEEAPEEQSEPSRERPEEARRKSHRTYTVEPAKLSISIGGRATGIRSAQRMATFVIKDLGMVKGSKLFHVTVTSYRSGGRMISSGDFHALTSRGMRIDPRPLKGYSTLRANLGFRKTASGHVAFPTDEELKWMVVRSDVAEFKLNLETGDFASQRGPF